MAKLATLVAAFAVLLVAATATRSTVTTVEVDDEGLNQQWGGGGRCRQQLQMTGELNHCRMFLMDQARCGGRGSQQWGSRGSQQWGSRRSRCQYGQCDDDNQQFGMRGTCPSMHFEQCCDQLSQMNQQCRCEGLREIVMRQPRGQFSGGQQQMEDVASNLPQMCGMGPQFCQVSRRYLD